MVKSLIRQLVHRMLVLQRAAVASVAISLPVRLIIIEDLNGSGTFERWLLVLFLLQKIDNLTDVTVVISALAAVMETITDAALLVL